MNDAKLYWLPHCSTCKKAHQFLENSGVKIACFHNLKEEPLSRREVKELVEMLGGAENLFSKRAIKYREMNLNERELSADEMLDLMSGEYTFIKRPVLVINGKATAGFSEKIYEKFLEQF
jgi:arsenate reductase (glutaredoxin)